MKPDKTLAGDIAALRAALVDFLEVVLNGLFGGALLRWARKLGKRP